jgi:hypothetical protein
MDIYIYIGDGMTTRTGSVVCEDGCMCVHVLVIYLYMHICMYVCIP